jgi:hypothetical protein
MTKQFLTRHAAVVTCLLFVLSLPPHLLADQINDGDSPSGKIHFQVRGNDNDGKEIWLFPPNRQDQAVKLCDTEGWGNLVIHFAPDDYWIIVQDGGASLGVFLRLFRREKGLTFKEIKDADIGGKAERLAFRQAGLPDTCVLDHRYDRVLAWDDPGYVLIRISGSGSNFNKQPVAVDGWCAFYELATGRFVFDLNKINKDAVTRFPSQ